MKELIKLFFVVFILVMTVPLIWLLIKELFFFTANIFSGLTIGVDGLGYLAFIVLCVILIIVFLKIIFD